MAPNDPTAANSLPQRSLGGKLLQFLDSGLRGNEEVTGGFLASIAAALVLATGFIVYYPGLTGPFLFDDFPNIVDNEHLKMAALTLNQLMAAAFSSRAGPLYRPIAMASFALNRYFAGLDPYWFKLTNVLIHLLCGLLVIVLSRLLLVSYREQHAPWLSRRRTQWVAMLLAAAWILHPLNLTAVLYVVQRMVSIASFFMLASMCFYVIGRRRQLAGRVGWPLIWIATPIAAGIGLFGKEIAALTPLYLVCVEAVIFRFRNNRESWDKPIIALYTLGLIIPFLYGLTWLLLHLHQFLGGYGGRDFTITQRLMTEARIMMLSVKWTLIPNIRDLSLYHDDLAISTGLLSPATTLLSLVGIAVLFTGAWLLRRRAPLISLGILWFFAGHALESTILPLELVHEHRNYLADYGLLLALGSLLLLPKASARSLIRLGGAIGIVFVALVAGATWTRASEWSTRLSQAFYEAKHHPDSPRATYSYAALEAEMAMRGDLKNWGKAFTDLETAQAKDKNIMPNVALIMLAATLKQPIKTSWISNASHKLATRDVTAEDVDSLDKLVRCTYSTCKLSVSQVKSIFQGAFSNPRLGKRSYNFANILTIYVNYLTHHGADLNKLIAMMYQVVEAQPQIPQYRINLANALLVDGNIEGANIQIGALRKMNTVGQLDEAIENLETMAAHEKASKAKHPSKVPSEEIHKPPVPSTSVLRNYGE